MNKTKTLSLRIAFVCSIVVVFTSILTAEILYVDSNNGSDENSGTKEKPLQSLNMAAKMVNNSSASGPTAIKVLPGVYNLTETVVFNNTRPYSVKDRLVIEASILPDDAGWKPRLMPVIFSTGKPDQMSGIYGIRVKVSHVTICGLKFLGNATPNTMYAPIERIGTELKDLLVTQCMFVGDNDSFNIYCPVIATGDKLIVDHCIFHGCHASAVFWDGIECRSYKKNAMRYCIVDGGHQSGVWTCQTAEDFEFHNNVITDTEFFWLRKRIGKPKKYKMNDCVVNTKDYSGYAVETGPTGLTGAEVKYDEINIVKDEPVVLVRNKKAKNYMHVVPGTLGRELGAGLFKEAFEKERE